jgi:hypothetical protein
MNKTSFATLANQKKLDSRLYRHGAFILAMANGLVFYRDAFGGFECDETSFCFH